MAASSAIAELVLELECSRSPLEGRATLTACLCPPGRDVTRNWRLTRTIFEKRGALCPATTTAHRPSSTLVLTVRHDMNSERFTALSNRAPLPHAVSSRLSLEARECVERLLAHDEVPLPESVRKGRGAVVGHVGCSPTDN